MYLLEVSAILVEDSLLTLILVSISTSAPSTMDLFLKYKISSSCNGANFLTNSYLFSMKRTKRLIKVAMNLFSYVWISSSAPMLRILLGTTSPSGVMSLIYWVWLAKCITLSEPVFLANSTGTIEVTTFVTSLGLETISPKS